MLNLMTDKPTYYVQWNPTREFIQLLYRTMAVYFNDGTLGWKLEYLSSFNVWTGTSEKDREAFIREKLEVVSGKQLENLLLERGVRE